MKRKILFLTILVLFISLLFINNSYGYTTEDFNSQYSYLDFKNSVQDNTLDIFVSSFLEEQENNNEYYLVYNLVNSTSYYLITSPNNFIVNINDTDITCNYTSSFTKYCFTFQGGQYHAYIQRSNSDDVYAFSLDKSRFNFLRTNHNIYDSNNQLVFQVPVQVITLTQVLEEQKENNPQMVMKEILVILPTILVVVVSYLGLRKALAMLSAILHRS